MKGRWKVLPDSVFRIVLQWWKLLPQQPLGPFLASGSILFIWVPPAVSAEPGGPLPPGRSEPQCHKSVRFLFPFVAVALNFVASCHSSYTWITAIFSPVFWALQKGWITSFIISLLCEMSPEVFPKMGVYSKLAWLNLTTLNTLCKWNRTVSVWMYLMPLNCTLND